jgi:hypothetical protein
MRHPLATLRSGSLASLIAEISTGNPTLEIFSSKASLKPLGFAVHQPIQLGIQPEVVKLLPISFSDFLLRK